MKLTIEPTPELYDVPINGTKVPVRIWKGHTAEGTTIEAYVLSITTSNEKDHRALEKEVPEFMRASRDVYRMDVGEP